MSTLYNVLIYVRNCYMWYFNLLILFHVLYFNHVVLSSAMGVQWIKYKLKFQSQTVMKHYGMCSSTVAQTRHFTKHFLHDFTKHLLHDFTISSTILQNISSTILQFPPRFYKAFPPRFCNFLHDFTKHLLHDFTISSTILQFPPRFYNFLHDFTCNIVEEIAKSWRKL